MLENDPADGAVRLDGETTDAGREQDSGPEYTPQETTGAPMTRSASTEVQTSAVNQPSSGSGATQVTSGAVVTSPRRRAASRPAGPPPEPDEIPPVTTTTAAAPAEAQPPADVPEAPAEAAEKPKRTRRRASAKAASAEPELSGADEAAAETGAAAESAVPAAGDEPAEAKPTRRTRTRRSAAEPAAESAPVSVPAAEEAPATRRRRTRKKDESVTERSSAMSAAEAEVAAALRLGRTDERPQADDLLDVEPLDDEETPLGEAPADVSEDISGDVSGDADTDEDAREAADARASSARVVADPFGMSERESVAPSVTFQPPAAVFQPLFQAPDPFAAAPARPQPAVPAAWPQDQDQDQDQDEAEESDEAQDLGDDEDGADGETDGDGSHRRRRRRRGGRGRGTRARDAEEGEESEAEEAQATAAEEEDERAAEEADEEQGGSRRRRRRRRRGGDEAEATVDDPPNTVVRIRAPRATRSTSIDEVQSVRGSTRLEAKKQRRREGRELGRRRPPIITESEFLARRESVERVMVVRRRHGRTQIAVLEDGVLVEHYVDRESSQSYVGNVYLGKVQNVLPSMEAAFVDIGKGRNAVLYAGEVNFDTAGLEGQPKRIEAALKSGQSVLVQVTKDPMGHKGARLTSQISLPGRYLVYVPDGSMTGISRKLPDKERTRLKQILRKVMPENAGVIVRTAAEGASEEELSRDVARLSAQWENIQRKAKSASPPELLSGEPDLTVRVVRDVFNEDFSSLVVEGDEVWQTVDDYVNYVAPHLVERLTKWDGQGDIFAAYRVDEQIAKGLDRKVWLPSGGSLVIDRTEAMTVVDVNTGKFTGQGGNLEETVTRNNLEAAEEIVRQLRLRDIGGIIVIDFIDMVLEGNRDLVLRRLLECLARDRTKHQVAEVTSLGLVQMTRKRVGQGLLEAFSTPCECCNGRGLIISTEPVEAKPEPRGTQGKMAIEKAVADKLGAGEGAVVAASANGRDSVTDAMTDDGDTPPAQPRGRRRSRRKQAE
ncbi:Rne/Rng family ribonuclease [Planotetraspora kaengkrachanensis]|uniref:Ribonuclease E n=1 Tax=Planotetraspora kaengkrachanensis TaxID=575193 RepID=A0A8J3M228_9ACTN|nr:Rne/Rng family ribonuclease [Planotetraspora kaengkrachanensis]GIG80773.1 hypothetical protein Pka01_39000 [Planotetraspora kaengkrachanensis]